MSERKRRRFGRVRQLPSGRWQARYPGPDGQLRAAPYTFEREADADRWLGEVETDLRRGDWTDPDAGRIPLGLYAKAWIEERPGLAVRTVELYEGLLRNHIDPYLGDVMLADLSPAKVRRWRKDRLDECGPVTVAKAYRLLKAIMNTALLDDKLIKMNPCTIKGGGKEDSPERPTATIEQALAAADAMQPRYRLMVLLATFASLRFAKMVGLQRGDFDLDAGLVYVRRQAVQTNGGKIVVTGPKSEAGKRRVVVPAFLVPEIRTHLRTYVKPGDEAWVFLGPKGARPTRNNFHKVWNKARTAAGIPSLHLHDLRHTGNTLAAETGATLRELMDRMGHASTRAALIYLHAREERGQAIAAGINAMVTRATRKTRRGGKGHAKGTGQVGVQK
ncbi:MAG TPA: tyrosine-type recombinase/integrase [Actinophytocola sp.]|uniref:tyrosine-type recombinase/integrase n=1 Tax=Actinophytocola sp. TaxID=1872138 RepID=UPI002DBE2758|nr:tyrosine-type recombinase/integrase [Actinophytocola sp.]HEU5476141.1 tyrosine-type recombinase/integrase [Actinophytocola sp.]